MSLEPASTVSRPSSYGILWVSLGALGVGVLLGIWQPLLVVDVGAFGLLAGPSAVGMLFMLCAAAVLIAGIIAMFSRSSRDLTLPILAVSTMLSLGMIGGNVLASSLDVGYARPRPAPTFVPPDAVGVGWARTGSMLEARHEHTATLLQDGRVLVVGGSTKSEIFSASAELYDPTTGTWSATGSRLLPAVQHVAVLLRGGGVLVLSGAAGQHDAEVWNPDTGTWTAVHEMSAPRGAGFTATVLADGRVLVAGGTSLTADEVFASAEVYDPGSDTWSVAAPMGAPRFDHTATLLGDGRVLVAGGRTTGWMPLVSAELYDPVDETWTDAGPMQGGRFNHAAVTLDDGAVLLLGGADVTFPPPPAEAFEPDTGEWRTVGTFDLSGTLATEALMVGDGKLFVMASMSEYELFDLQAPRAQNRVRGQAEHGTGYTATLLQDGRVLVVGGYVPRPSDGSGYVPGYEALATAHTFDPAAVE